MNEAVPAGVGTMGAIIGLDKDAVERVCTEVEEGVVEPATYNSPGQVVIAGHTAAVDEGLERAKAAGARRVQRLNVSGPFHCSLLTPAGEKLAEVLESISVQDPDIPVIANVDAQKVTRAEDVRRALIEQVSKPVLWEQTVHTLIEDGVGLLIEAGAGRTLCGLARRIDRSLDCMPCGDKSAVEKVVARKKGDGVI